MMNEIETQCMDNIVCPYCGYKDQDSWERNINEGECSDTDECGECGETYKWHRSITVDYSSEKITEKQL